MPTVAWVPKVIYNTGVTTVTWSIPQGMWKPRNAMIGGGDISGAGIPESFTVRRDYLVSVRLRFYESEWPATSAWLEFSQDNASVSFDYWFNKLDAATAHTCYLAEPGPGQEIAPERDPFVGAYAINLTFRRTTAVRFDVRASGW